jgi:hypothetical protein
MKRLAIVSALLVVVACSQTQTVTEVGSVSGRAFHSGNPCPAPP